MAKSTFVAIRATPEDKRTLHECSVLSGNSYAGVVREALRRYLADLKRGRRTNDRRSS